MRLAIVEDEASDLKETLSALERFSKENSIPFVISTFGSSEEFLESGQTFDIGLFDIALPELSGMDLAHKIRATNQEMAIVFLTNMAKYAIEGYSVNACGYVLKPVNYFNFSLSLKRAILSFKATAKSEQKTMIRVAGRSIPLQSVLYCEVRDHTTIFHLRNEQVSCRCPLSDIERQGAGQFVKAHASYLVNLAMITLVSGMEITLENGEKIPISRSKKKEFMSAMAVFMGRVK